MAGDHSAARPGTNVLVKAPSLSTAKTETCLELSGGTGTDIDLLRISYSSSPEELLGEWRERYGDLPAQTGIVVVGDQASLRGSHEDLPDSVFVTTANPNDITGLGMRLNNYLADLDGDRQLVVCFDSLTELLQFVDIQAAFKFLHMFAGQLREADAVGHFHIDPVAHDQQTVSRLKPLFDDEVDCT